MGQKYAAYDAGGNITGFYDSIDSPVPVGATNVIQITQAQWQTCIGQPGQWYISSGALAQVPPPTAAQQLANSQATQIAAIDAACRTSIYAGFTSSALGSPHTYPAKDTDQQNLSASVLSSVLPNVQGGWTTNFWCADAGGNWALRSHTATQIQQVGVDGKSAILSSIAKKAQLEQQIMAATTVDAVHAIVWG